MNFLSYFAVKYAQQLEDISESWKYCLGYNYCNDAKDDAFARGQGLDWIPDNCNECSTVRRIFEQTVTYREWQEPLMYADDEPHTMWAWNPLSHHKHCF